MTHDRQSSRYTEVMHGPGVWRGLWRGEDAYFAAVVLVEMVLRGRKEQQEDVS